MRVRVDGQIIFNTSYGQIEAALSGYGIAYLPDNLVEGHLAAGRLIQVLDEWSPMRPGGLGAGRLPRPNRTQPAAATSSTQVTPNRSRTIP